MSPPIRWFVYAERRLVLRVTEQGARLPDEPDLDRLAPGLGVAPREAALDVSLGVGPARALELAEASLPDGFVLSGLREAHALLPADQWTLAGRALQLLEWRASHRFCGRCGAPTEAAPGERALACPACGQLHFPRVSPAVIVLVERDGRALLGRSPRFPEGLYSALAGFVEPGESLEETVRREVQEEVGVRVDDVRYFGSQPWPFPHSLMVGFTARWAGGELAPDGEEIVDAGWFAPDALPRLPTAFSIARSLIDDFVARHGG